MKPIRFPRTEEATVNAVHFWCRNNLHDGFNVRHDTRISEDGKGKNDHVVIETFSLTDYTFAKLRWVG